MSISGSRDRFVQIILCGTGSLGIILLATLATPAAGAEWTGREAAEDGVLNVYNTAEPIDGVHELQLEEQWRIGGDSEAEEDFFGVITDIVVDEDGKFYVLDGQLAEIKVYDSAGGYLGSIGREGEGPGEFRRPIDLVQLDRQRLGVIQPFPSKMVLLTTDGTPDGDYPFEPEGTGFSNLVAGAMVGDELALVYGMSQPGEGSFERVIRLGLFDLDGEPRGVIHQASSRMDYSNSLCVETEWNHFDRCWSATPQGELYVRTDFSAYTVGVWTADGSLDRMIHREYRPHERAEEDIERIERNWARSIARWVPKPTFEIEEAWNPIFDLYGRPDGSLWVRTSRGARDLDDGVMVRFDEFGPRGRYTREWVALGDFDGENDGLFLTGDHLLVVTDLESARQAWRGGGEEEDVDEEPEPMEIICYRMSPAPVAAK